MKLICQNYQDLFLQKFVFFVVFFFFFFFFFFAVVVAISDFSDTISDFFDIISYTGLKMMR